MSPNLGSSNRIHPSATGKAGRKYEIQNRNSNPPLNGISVRARSQAMKMPTTVAMSERVIASEKVL